MKTKLVVGLLSALVLVAGCVRTVDGRKTAGVPFLKDKFEDRYERSVDQILQATKEVISEMGTLVNESTIYGQPNPIKTVEGKVNQRSVWMRLEALDQRVTEVAVQARGSGGGADVDLAHELEKQIALKLVR